MVIHLYDNVDTDLANESGWYEKEGYVVRNVSGFLGKRTTQRFHVQVMCRMMNVSRIPSGYDVHHKNENKLDNRRSNLELLSKGKHISTHWLGKKRPELSERNKMNAGKELPYMARNTQGDNNPRSVVTDEQWLWAIEELFKGNFKSNAEVARYLGIQRTQVGFVLSGKSRAYLQPQILALKQCYGRL